MSHQQFYYTSCPQGMRVDGPCDFGIRAASPGARTAGPVFAKHALYELRAKVPGRPAGAPPVRLAWLDAQTDRVLAHSIFVLEDPMGRVGGNFFTHAVLGLRADQVSLAEVIGTWGSDDWKRAWDGGLELDTLDVLPAGGTFDQTGLQAFLSAPDDRRLAGLVLSAWLGRLSDPAKVGKVYVVRPPEDVAWCVYAVASALPPAFTRGLTFSTYEMSVLKSPAWLVGTWGDGGPPAEPLPDQCAKGSNQAWDERAKRPPAALNPFADGVMTALADGRAEEVAGFVAACAAWKVETVELVRLAWAYRHGDRAADTVARLLGHAGTSHGLFCGGAALTEVIVWVLDGGEFTARVTPALTAAVENGWVAQAPVDAAYNAAAVLAAKAGDLPRLQRAAEGVVGEQTFPAELVDLPLGADNAGVWGYLLPMILDKDGLTDEQRGRWLGIGRNRLDELFELKDADAAAGLALHLADGEPLPEGTAALLKGARRDLRRPTVRALLNRDRSVRDRLAKLLPQVFSAADLGWLYEELGQPVPVWLLRWVVQAEAEAETPGPLAARVVGDCRDARALDDQLYKLFRTFAEQAEARAAHRAADLAADLQARHRTLPAWDESRLGVDAVASLTDPAALVTLARFPSAARHWAPGNIQSADEARRRLGLVVKVVSDEAALEGVFTKAAERYGETDWLFELAFRRPVLGARLLIMRWYSNKKREVGRVGVDQVRYDSFPVVAAEFARQQKWELLDLLLARWLGATPGDRAKTGWGLSAVARAAFPLLEHWPAAESVGRLRKLVLGAWARAGDRPDPDVINFLNWAATLPAGGGDSPWPDLIGLALGQAPDAAAAGRGLDALRGLWSEDWADDWAVLSRVLFERLLRDPARWADPAAVSGWVGQLDGLCQLLARRCGGAPTDRRPIDWVTQQIADELTRPVAELWEEWVAVRAAALVRYHLDRHPAAQADEAHKIFAAVRQRTDAEDVRVAFFRGTSGWPRQLLELCYRASKDPAPPPRPGILRRVFGQ